MYYNIIESIDFFEIQFYNKGGHYLFFFVVDFFHKKLKTETPPF